MPAVDDRGRGAQWSVCDSEGRTTRRRHVVMPAEGGGRRCPHLTEWKRCVPDVDCVLSRWGPWSECDGTGRKWHTRSVVVTPSGQGAPCPPLIGYANCTPGVYELRSKASLPSPLQRLAGAVSGAVHRQEVEHDAYALPKHQQQAAAPQQRPQPHPQPQQQPRAPVPAPKAGFFDSITNLVAPSKPSQAPKAGFFDSITNAVSAAPQSTEAPFTPPPTEAPPAETPAPTVDPRDPIAHGYTLTPKSLMTPVTATCVCDGGPYTPFCLQQCSARAAP